MYSADSIQVLSGLEAVRKRPGMYVGDVFDGSGLHHLLWEVVSNGLDEHLAGRASKVRVSMEGNLAEVEDDGGGISLEPYRQTDKTLLEVVLTILHAGPTFDGHLPHVHVGSYGVGLAVVNALSESLEVEVRRDGWSWHQRYARGEPLGPLERGERTTRTGTRLRFRADASIFGPLTFDRALVRARLGELAAFNPGLEFELMGEKIHEPRGIVAFLPEGLSNVFAMRTVKDDILVEVALGWGKRGRQRVRSFVGQAATKLDGTHVDGFWNGLTAAMPEADLQKCHAIVHVDLRHPRFGAPTRDQLTNPEVKAVVADCVYAALSSRG